MKGDQEGRDVGPRSSQKSHVYRPSCRFSSVFCIFTMEKTEKTLENLQLGAFFILFLFFLDLFSFSVAFLGFSLVFLCFYSLDPQ